MFISNDSVVEVQWWLDNVKKLNGKPIRTPSIDFWIETDAYYKAGVLHSLIKL